VSLGHATFYGIYAYTTALLSANAGCPARARGCRGVTALIGFHRHADPPLRGHYLAMLRLTQRSSS
jgi:ABC-type branched-subunit amino acid transport system permease subunit